MPFFKNIALSLVLLSPALAAAQTPDPLSLPASYSGTLPCADCPGIDTRLNLLPDGQFQMRMTYLERSGAGFDSIGLWQVTDGKLTLKQGEHIVEQFQIKGKTPTLIKLDMQGQPIDSKLNYSLVRKNIFQPMKPTLDLQGLFVYFADAARFTPCATGKSMPVKMEGDYPQLEKAYLAARKEPQQALLVNVEGQISKQPRMESEGSEQVLRVKKFVSLDNASACPATTDPAAASPTTPPSADADHPAALQDRTWNLVQLGEQAIPPSKDERPGAHIILSSKDQRVSGSGGCNRLMGGYTLDGNKLSFSKMASTMMMCEQYMEQEQHFLKALSEVVTWSMEGNTLILKNASGQILLKLGADGIQP